MPSSAPARPPAWARWLRAVSLPLVVGLIAMALAAFEARRPTAKDRLVAYTAGDLPQLKGDALEAFADQALALWPESAQPRVVKAMSLAEQGHLQQARGLLEEALAINRRNPMLLHLYARVLEALREDPETIREIRDELRRYFPLDPGV